MQAVAAITGPSGTATAGWYARNVADETAQTTDASVTDPARLVFDEQALALADDVWRVARRLTRDPQAAEDLMQEAYTRAFRSWKQYEPGTNLRAWLLRIVHDGTCPIERPAQRIDHPTEQRGTHGDTHHVAGAVQLRTPAPKPSAGRRAKPCKTACCWLAGAAVRPERAGGATAGQPMTHGST